MSRGRAGIKYAADLLTKDLLPHIGIKAFSETKKAYFVGSPRSEFGAVRVFPGQTPPGPREARRMQRLGGT